MPTYLAGFNSPEVKPKKAEGFVLSKIHHTSLFLVDLHPRRSELLKEPSIRGLHKRIPSPKAIHKDHQINGIPALQTDGGLYHLGLAFPSCRKITGSRVPFSPEIAPVRGS